MPTPIRYPLDKTGINPDNLVANEIHTLSNIALQYRAVIPTYRPFFGDSLVVYDNISDQLLVKNTDYACVELLQEASLITGKEVFEVILIINPNVSNEVRITYQTLGGNYQNNITNNINMYEAVMSDNRPIDWVNILNKPMDYPPGSHYHLITDMVGFEPEMVMLERIRNAIVLSNIPAFEAVIDYVNKRALDPATEADIDVGAPVNKAITLTSLLYALNKFNFNTVTVSPSKGSILPASSITFSVTSTNLPDNTYLFWVVEHIDTTNADFFLLSNVMTVIDNKCSFVLPVAVNKEITTGLNFRIAIHRGGVDGPVMARSNILTIGGNYAYTLLDYITAFNTCCLLSGDIEVTAESYFILQGKD